MEPGAWGVSRVHQPVRSSPLIRPGVLGVDVAGVAADLPDERENVELLPLRAFLLRWSHIDLLILIAT